MHLKACRAAPSARPPVPAHVMRERAQQRTAPPRPLLVRALITIAPPDVAARMRRPSDRRSGDGSSGRCQAVSSSNASPCPPCAPPPIARRARSRTTTRIHVHDVGEGSAPSPGRVPPDSTRQRPPHIAAIPPARDQLGRTSPPARDVSPQPSSPRLPLPARRRRGA